MSASLIAISITSKRSVSERQSVPSESRNWPEREGRGVSRVGRHGERLRAPSRCPPSPGTGRRGRGEGCHVWGDMASVSERQSVPSESRNWPEREGRGVSRVGRHGERLRAPIGAFRVPELAGERGERGVTCEET